MVDSVPGDWYELVTSDFALVGIHFSEENIKRDFKNLELFRMNFKRTSTLLFLFVTADSCFI